jgi:hypothetical protein
VHLALVYAQATPTPTLTPTPSPTLTPTPRENSLRISALHYEGADEYVEITNAGPRSQQLYLWRILSVVGHQEYTFPWGIELAVGASVRVHSGPSAIDAPPTDLFWQKAYVWLNAGDEARLYDDKGVERDRYAY